MKTFMDIIPFKYRRAEPTPVVAYPYGIKGLSPQKIVVQ